MRILVGKRRKLRKASISLQIGLRQTCRVASNTGERASVSNDADAGLAIGEKQWTPEYIADVCHLMDYTDE